MRGHIVRSTVIITLAAVIIFLLSGCSLFAQSASAKKELDERGVSMIDQFVERDTEGAYALLHPNTISREDFDISAERIYKFFLAGEGYTWKSETYNYSRSVGTSGNNRIKINGTYRVQTNGHEYLITVEWITDESGKGFTVFQIAQGVS